MAADYTPEQRSRNQLSIILCTVGAAAIVVLSGTLQSWGVGSFIASLAVITTIAAAVWKLFGARSARPLRTDRPQARRPSGGRASR